MKPVEQTQLVKEGVSNGDCWRACIASILECDINDFPAWEYGVEWSDYYPHVLKVLNEKGYQWGQFTIENTDFDCLDKCSFDGYVIAVGKSPRSTAERRINHAVVWKNGIAHDPHPDKTGILDIITFEVLQKINAEGKK